MNGLIVICGLGVASLLAEIANFRKWLPWLIIAGLAGAMVLLMAEWNTTALYFNNMMIVDNFTIAFTLLLLLLAIFWFWMSVEFFRNQPHETDRAALILFAIAGGMIMISFANMAMLFLGIEVLSLSLYVLAGSRKESLFSTEASFKYFLMGSFATGFLLFGIALVYGATGSFHVAVIAERLSAMQEYPFFLFAGAILIFAGIAFKISAVPFHFWAPDVYEGAPTTVTAFMSTIVKVAAVGAFYRLFASALAPLQEEWIPVVRLVTVLTLVVANVTAVYQTNVKRMLAYSSVGHIGYLLLAFVSDISSGSTFFYYLSVYAVSSITAFFILILLEAQGEGTTVEDFKGLFKRNTFLGLSITVAMLSLAGIPPLAGFFAKYMVFALALENGQVGLVVLAVVTSLIGVYYYFKVIIAVFGTPSAPAVRISENQKLLIGILVAITVILGIFPDLIRII